MITTGTLAKISKAMCYIHTTLFLMMLTPLMYGIGEVELENTITIVVLKCLLIALPVVVTDNAEHKSKNLVVYLLVCVATLALVAAFSILAFMPMSVYDLCYAITLIGETLLLMVTRMVDRLKKADDLQGIEPSIFDKPKIGYVWYFVVMYIFGILFNSKMLCDVAFFAAIAYMLAAYVYEYLLGTKDYLYINNRTRGIPRKRLYGISTAMVLLFLMLAFICILPSVFLSGYRRYTDVRHWFDDVPPVEYEYEGDGGFNPTVQQENPIMAFDPEGGEINEPSKLVNTVFWVIGAACFIGIIYGIIQTIRQIFKDFRNTLDENGDIIEEIKDDEAPYSEDELHIRGSHIDSEAMRIRRRYKKTIKKHRRDLPKPYESPNEIEENAGLGGDEEMKVLHGQYENARYGRWS